MTLKELRTIISNCASYRDETKIMIRLDETKGQLCDFDIHFETYATVANLNGEMFILIDPKGT
jgi:hypothetical protein